LPTEGRLNMTKSIGDDVFVPMTTTGESANDTEEEPKGCRSACGDVLVCHGRIVLCFP